MAALGCKFSDEECIKRLRNLKESLKETNCILEAFMKDIVEFYKELRAFKDKLNDEKFAASLNDQTTLEVADSVVEYLTEKNRDLNDLETVLNGNLHDLEVFLETDNISVTLENSYFWELVTAIIQIQKSVSQKAKEFKNNKNANLLRKLLLDSKRCNSK